MAKILPGANVSQISGTTVGTTYQNWRGMLVMREKPTPHNPMSPRQTTVRSITAFLSRRWRDVLTEGLRTAWNQKAKITPWFNVFGRTIEMTGINLYVKQNFVLLDHFLPVQDTPVPEVIPPSLFDITVDPPDDTLKLFIPHLTDEIITAQKPFLDVKIAGGFTKIALTPPVPPNTFYEVEITSQALPQGRVHQMSDFKHAIYLDDTGPGVPPSEPSSISGIIGEPPLVKNVVFSITRFNKYGNFTPPRIFSKIVTAG